MAWLDSEAQPLLHGIDEGRKAIALSLNDASKERAYERSEQIEVFGSDDDDEESISKFSWKKLWMFTGPGFLMSIAYLDPGNIESDLQAGAVAGYYLLWILLVSTLVGLFVQLLAARLSVATGFHLAEHCRDEYPQTARVLLWIMTEIAIIGADIQEVIGSAIAFRILSNGAIPLWGGVLMTGIYGFLFLFLENFGVRKLEAFFGLLILIMGASFAGVFVKAGPNAGQILSGLITPYVPPDAVHVAVGILGAVVMPHNIFLHSALVQSRSIDSTRQKHVREAFRYYSIESAIALLLSFVINLFIMSVFAKSFYGTDIATNIGLANAGEALQAKYGRGYFPILYIWAAGLLAAGQSSTMTGTYTGQFVMAGFLNLKIRKWVRVIVTRSVSIIPTIIVALAFDTSQNELDKMNEWLNVLQSIQLPFAIIPLMTLVSNERIMGVFKIGILCKVITGLIASVVLGINMYFVADFVLKLNNHSLRVVLTLVATTSLYMSFIAYLVIRPMKANRYWAIFTSLHKRIDDTTNESHTMEH